jgi:hypothetical protein
MAGLSLKTSKMCKGRKNNINIKMPKVAIFLKEGMKVPIPKAISTIPVK